MITKGTQQNADARPVPLEFAAVDVRRSTSPLQRLVHCPWPWGPSRKGGPVKNQMNQKPWGEPPRKMEQS